jgi:HTH-type transcriptional regulator/antitoxin HigA
MATKTARSTSTDTYPKLIKQFRLVPIKDDDHLKAAHEMIDRLMQDDLEPSGQDYLSVLADLVEAYEDRHFPIPDASEVDVLRELMRSNGLTQTDLAKKVGIVQSTISAVLNGSRKLTKNQVIKLAKFFNVTPAAFWPNAPTGEQNNSSTDAKAPSKGATRRVVAARHA